MSGPLSGRAARFAAADLPRAVRAHLGLADGPLILSYPRRQGATSQVAIVETPGGKRVIKRAQGEQFRDWLAAEYRVLRALPPLPVPAPRACGIFQERTASGSVCWLVMEFLAGEPMRQALARCSEPAARARLLHAWGVALAALHATPPPPALAADPAPWLDRRLAQAAFNLAHYDDYAEVSPALLTQLRDQRPAPVAATLIHGDFTLDNTLVEGEAIAGFIDWCFGDAGDPRYDLALAVRPKAGIFGGEADVAAFFAGYGRAPLSQAESRYFTQLYEYF